MYANIELHLPTTQQLIKTCQVIYENDDNDLNNVIDFCHAYHPPTLLNEQTDAILVFKGKKIRHTFTHDKTLMVIHKINCHDIVDELMVNNTFVIDNHHYKLVPVTNLLMCELLYAQGGIFSVNEIHAAVFFPYFMSGNYNDEKISLILVNVIYEKFTKITKKIFNTLNFKLFFEDNEVNIENISCMDIARWITLHEYMHNSGPLSLFTSQANKFTSKHYGFIEEMRVDLSSIKYILDHGLLINHETTYVHVISLILLERIIRGALYNYQPQRSIQCDAMFSKEVEGDAAISLMFILIKYQILDIHSKTLHLTNHKLLALCNEILKPIYHYETLAREHSSFAKTSLRFAKIFRSEFIPISQAAIAYLTRYSVQDCIYKLKFTL